MDKAEHPLVAATRAALETRGTRFESNLVTPNTREDLDICVTRGMIPRALALAATLIREAIAKGHNVVVIKKRKMLDTGTYAVVNGVEISIRVRETFNIITQERAAELKLMPQKTVIGDRKFLRGSGRLSVKIARSHIWTDSKHARVETKIPKMVRMLEEIAASELKSCAEGARRRKQLELDQMIRDERNRLVAGVKDRIEIWGRYEQARSYLAALEQSLVTEQLTPSERDHRQELIEWTRYHLATIDPFARIRRTDTWLDLYGP